MRVPNPFESIRRRGPTDSAKKRTPKISKKDETIRQLASKIVSDPIDIELIDELAFELGSKKNLLFLTEKKNEFQMCTIKNSSKKKQSTRLKWQTVSVMKSGMVVLSPEDGRSKMRYHLVEDFIDHYEPISPPSKEQFDKARLISQMAHAWGLSGFFHLMDGIALDKTGSYANQCMTTLLDHIDDLDFPEEFRDSLFNQDEFKKALKYALQQSLELEALKDEMKTYPEKWEDVRKKIVKMINHSDKTGIPALISSGYDAHQTYMVYHNQCLSITNRGSKHPNNPSGTDYFTVDPKTLKKKLRSRSFLKKFVGETRKSNFLKFQPYRERESLSLKGEMVEKLQLTFLDYDRKKRQKVGNCAFANLISALHSFATMKEYPSDQDFHNISIVEFADGIKLDHKAFTFAVRTGILDHAARIFSAEDSQFASDYLTACNKMMTKIQNYEEEGKFPRVEDRKKILKLCQYYFERLSTSNKEMSAYYEFINQIIRLHYPGVTEEEAFELLVGRESEWMMIQNEIDKTYSIFYTDSSGSPTKILFPNASVPTIEEFTRRFPKERRVSIEDLHADSHIKAELYQEVQMLSVGRVSSSEEQVLLHREGPGTWLVRESSEEMGRFAVTFVTLDHEIQTWPLTPESLSTPLDVFHHQFKPKDRINPLSIRNKLEAFHSGELEDAPLEFKKPKYVTGVLKPGVLRPFKPPRSKDASIDDIVSAIKENLTSAIPDTKEIKRYLLTLLCDDKFSTKEIWEIESRLTSVAEDCTHPDESAEVMQWIKGIFTDKMQVEEFKHQMSLLRKAGVKTQLIETIFMREDVPVGSWYIAPSDFDDHSFTLIMKLSDSEGRPYTAQLHKPIDGRAPCFKDHLTNQKAIYRKVPLHSELPDTKIPKKIRIKIWKYQDESTAFTDFKLSSHFNLHRSEAESLLRSQQEAVPCWLVRQSQSTPDAIVFSILDPEGKFSEQKYTHEQYLSFPKKKRGKKLIHAFRCFSEVPVD